MTRINGKFVRNKIDFYESDDGCFICTSHYLRGTNNYPTMTTNGLQESIHRHIYKECFGDIPEKNVVRHKCDNNLCINPFHLILGLQNDNIQDRVKRGRSAVGERSGRSKLTTENVSYIIKNPENLSTKDLAQLFNISTRHVTHVRSGKSWTHLRRAE
jgi:hypothetical protein